MPQNQHNSPQLSQGLEINRRNLLRGAAAASAVAAAASPLPAKAEIWEEGDIQCRPAVQEKAPAYEIDDALLLDFMNLSETLTGVRPLDRRLGLQYLQRYARNPDLTSLLPQLIKTYRAVADPALSRGDLVKVVQQKVMQDKTVGPAAEQLIYLWYVSAFFLPLDHAAAGRNWLYGPPDQYEQSLLWPMLQAHAPMTRGGKTGYWAAEPRPENTTY